MTESFAGRTVIVTGAGCGVGGVSTPAELAHGCLFLASAPLSYITGSNNKIDGGATIATSRRGGFLDRQLQQQRSH